MNIAFDVHGVLDSPGPYRTILQTFMNQGETVTIITGARHKTFIQEAVGDDYLETLVRLIDLDKIKFFSISDHISIHHPEKIDLSNPHKPRVTDKDLWDGIKGAYCTMNGIDLIFDDEPDYMKFMSCAKCLVINEKNEKRIEERSSTWISSI